jgi:hypothetical protein
MKFTVLAALIAVTNAIAPPKSAKEDLGADAESKAAQVLKEWHSLVTTTLKTKAGYDTADAAAKIKIDAANKAIIEAMKVEDTAMKKLAGYDTMTTE